MTSNREHRAAQWLIACSQTPTPERIADLAPHVDRYRAGSLRHRIASNMVGWNQIPTPEAVDQAVQARAAQQQTVRAEAAELVQDETVIQVVLDYITQVRTEQQTGPSWRDVARHLDRPYRQTATLLHTLRARGVITFDTSPGSLDHATRGPAPS